MVLGIYTAPKNQQACQQLENIQNLLPRDIHRARQEAEGRSIAFHGGLVVLQESSLTIQGKRPPSYRDRASAYFKEYRVKPCVVWQLSRPVVRV